jgi:hypothetical protein
MRSVLRSKPHLRCCLKHCRHCRIFFLTHPRNAGRNDLRCPFGCRAAHRRACSTQRSVEYYRGERGRFKKSIQNRKRYLVARAEQVQEDRPEKREQPHAPILKHVRMVVSLIEGCPMSWAEIEQMLKRNWRQHRIGGRRRMDYVVRQLNRGPP